MEGGGVVHSRFPPRAGTLLTVTNERYLLLDVYGHVFLGGGVCDSVALCLIWHVIEVPERLKSRIIDDF